MIRAQGATQNSRADRFNMPTGNHLYGALQMNIPWDDFVKYRDGYNNQIYHNDQRRAILDEFLDRYEEYQVVGARQVGDWVGATTSQLNGNKIWKIFPRYGLVSLVQKINHKSRQNRLLVVPILEWLEQWGGSPSLPPSAEDWIEDIGPTQEVLEKSESAVATRLLDYVITRLDEESPPDPKEAILYAKVAGDDTVSASIPDVTVNIRKLDADEYNAPKSYEALQITGSIGGEGFEIHDRTLTERQARPIIYLFALSGCYEQDASKLAGTERNPEGPDYVPASVYEQTGADNTDNDEAGDKDYDEVVPEDDSHNYGPYVLNKQDFIKESTPPEFWVNEETGALHFSYQLGPVWVRFTEER